ncbi:MAG: hypothetical protein PWP31_953, partial [Clostridia bacterium]|nr:hypothetical protein [Clostridia bacterium]
SYSSCPVAWKTSMSGMGVSLPEGKMLTTQIAQNKNDLQKATKNCTIVLGRFHGYNML